MLQCTVTVTHVYPWARTGVSRLNYNTSRRRAENGDETALRHRVPTKGWTRRGTNPDAGLPSVSSRAPHSSNRRVIRTEWSDEAMTDPEVNDPSGSVVDILITDPVGRTGGSGWQYQLAVPAGPSQRRRVFWPRKWFTTADSVWSIHNWTQTVIRRRRQQGVARQTRRLSAERSETVTRRWRQRKQWQPPMQHMRGRITEKLHNNQGGRDSGVRHVGESWSCLHGCSISGDGGTTNRVAPMPVSIQLTSVVRGWCCPKGTSDGEIITPEELITVTSNRKADVETIPETFSDIPSWISVTFRRKNSCKPHSARSPWNVLRLSRVYIIVTNMAWGLTAYSSLTSWLPVAKVSNFSNLICPWKESVMSVTCDPPIGELPDQGQEADDTLIDMDHTETCLIPRRHFRHLAIQGDDTTENPWLWPNHNSPWARGGHRYHQRGPHFNGTILFRNMNCNYFCLLDIPNS